MIKAVRHVGIVVSNIKQSLHFYHDLLGFKVIKDQIESGAYIDTILTLKSASVRTLKLEAPDKNLIELLYFETHPKHFKTTDIIDLGCSHLALTVDNIDKEYERLLGEGVIFNSSPEISPDNYAKVAFCRDPDGTWIELVEVLK